MIVLGLSTSTSRGSVALVEGDRTLAASSYLELRAHAERLFAAIDEVCRAAGISKQRIGAIACDVGPGSFTGVRVAVAAAHGIALALDRPTVGVPSLDAMAAAGASLGTGTIVAALDAFKEELYLRSYEANGGLVRALDAPCSLSRAEARAFLAERKAAGAFVIGSVLQELEITPSMRSDATDLPDASWISRLGTRVETTDLHLEPVYVRAPDAKPLAAPVRTGG